jgi:hypothetical protein
MHHEELNSNMIEEKGMQIGVKDIENTFMTMVLELLFVCKDIVVKSNIL